MIEVEIQGEFFCPHCGIRVYSWGEDTVSSCPHLVFAYGWNDPDTFLAVRPNFAKSFLSALMGSQAYRECLDEEEMEPLSEQEQQIFCLAKFSPGDDVATRIASYCRDLPERLFPELLSESTAVFKDDRPHSGVHIAVDLGRPKL